MNRTLARSIVPSWSLFNLIIQGWKYFLTGAGDLWWELKPSSRGLWEQSSGNDLNPPAHGLALRKPIGQTPCFTN